MSRHRKRIVPPPSGPVTYLPAEVVEGENELTIGRPIPPFVELTPAGPRFGVVTPAERVPPHLPGTNGASGPPVTSQDVGQTGPGPTSLTNEINQS
jgi:hypothetical protein